MEAAYLLRYRIPLRSCARQAPAPWRSNQLLPAVSDGLFIKLDRLLARARRSGSTRVMSMVPSHNSAAFSTRSFSTKTTTSSFSTARTSSAEEAGVNDLRHRTGPSRVLIFDTEGQPTIHSMTRAAVLQITQEAAVTTDESIVSIRQRGSSRGMRGDSVIEVQRVHARDIRQLDSAFAIPSEPSIEVRDQAILINTDPVRAIILRTRCLVFLRPNDKSMAATLQSLFEEVGANTDTSVPYEFKALEAVLAALCRHYQGQFDMVAPAISTSLSRLMSEQPSVGELNALRSFKNTMNEFQSRVDGVRRALMATLNNEEDMRLLYLTKLYADRSLLGHLWSFDSEEAEVLMENYLQDIYATQTRATLLQQRIQNTETVVKLRLDAMRNYLLGVNIMFSVAGISLSIGTFTVGVFGMNLLTGVESASGWFLGVSTFATTLMATSGYFTMRHFRRKGIFGPVIGSRSSKKNSDKIEP